MEIPSFISSSGKKGFRQLTKRLRNELYLKNSKKSQGSGIFSKKKNKSLFKLGGSSFSTSNIYSKVQDRYDLSSILGSTNSSSSLNSSSSSKESSESEVDKLAKSVKKKGKASRKNRDSFRAVNVSSLEGGDEVNLNKLTNQLKNASKQTDNLSNKIESRDLGETKKSLQDLGKNIRSFAKRLEQAASKSSFSDTEQAKFSELASQANALNEQISSSLSDSSVNSSASSLGAALLDSVQGAQDLQASAVSSLSEDSVSDSARKFIKGKFNSLGNRIVNSSPKNASTDTQQDIDVKQLQKSNQSALNTLASGLLFQKSLSDADRQSLQNSFNSLRQDNASLVNALESGDSSSLSTSIETAQANQVSVKEGLEGKSARSIARKASQKLSQGVQAAQTADLTIDTSGLENQLDAISDSLEGIKKGDDGLVEKGLQAQEDIAAAKESLAELRQVDPQSKVLKQVENSLKNLEKALSKTLAPVEEVQTTKLIRVQSTQVDSSSQELSSSEDGLSNIRQRRIERQEARQASSLSSGSRASAPNANALSILSSSIQGSSGSAESSLALDLSSFGGDLSLATRSLVGLSSAQSFLSSLDSQVGGSGAFSFS